MSARAQSAEPVPFLKMHGLGNDFVIIDVRKRDIEFSPSFLRAISDRKRGVGCDQIIVLQKPNASEADVHMAIYNQDGSKVEACGNATRCVGRLIFNELGKSHCVIETIAGLLPVWEFASQMIAVDFGPPRLAAKEIPLSKEVNTMYVPVTTSDLGRACCVNVGNPHAIFFVADVDEVPLDKIGPALEHDPIFPARCNIEIAEMLSKESIRMRVWERGVGITEACGSAACATLVAAVRLQLSARRAEIILDGGKLLVEWRDDNHIILIGPEALSYSGYLAEGFGNDNTSA